MDGKWDMKDSVAQLIFSAFHGVSHLTVVLVGTLRIVSESLLVFTRSYVLVR